MCPLNACNIISLYQQHPFFIRIKDNRLVQWGKDKRPLKNFFDHLKEGGERALYHMIQNSDIVIVGKKIKGDYVAIASNVQKPEKILRTRFSKAGTPSPKRRKKTISVSMARRKSRLCVWRSG